MRRRVGLFLICGLVLPLVAAANASAQGAVLELSPQSGPPGTVINYTGAGYNGSASGPNVGNVEVRLTTRESEPLDSPLIDASNRIAGDFVIPPGTAPGEYLVMATQFSVRGRQTFGGPGRAKLRVTATAAAAASVPPGGSAGGPPLALGGVLVALLLLGGGVLAAPRLRTLRRAATSRRTAELSR